MGGAQHVVYELVKYLNYAEFQTTIICTDGRVNSLLENRMLCECAGKYNILFLKKRVFTRKTVGFVLLNKIINKIIRTVLDISIIIELYKELQNIKPDLIHAHQHGIWAAYWAIPHGIPLITTIHTNPEVIFSRETEQIIFRLSLALKKNLLVAISGYNAEYIKSYFKLNDDYVRYINNGIDIRRFYRKNHTTFTFINASRQDENKNQALILKAFARVAQEPLNAALKLYLVGDGEKHQKLKQLADRLGIAHCTEFTGYVDSPVEYLAVSDVYVSSAQREGLSLSVLEAMAAGLAIIATDAGGVRDLARENGILIENNNEDALYEAMKLLYDNRDKCEVMGEISRIMVEDYSVQNMTKSYYALYDELFEAGMRKKHGDSERKSKRPYLLPQHNTMD
jgi:glycosyltransferase involved in cell wall biosynthesis